MLAVGPGQPRKGSKMAKTLLVTGGSRGLGAAVCRLAARDGYDVAFSYAGRADAAKQVVADIQKAGRKAVAIQSDVADPAQVVSLFDRAAQEIGYIDAFVSNAGIIHKGGPLADIPVEDIKRIVDVDLTAHLICLREAVRRMAKSRGGRGGTIVTMSSMAAISRYWASSAMVWPRIPTRSASTTRTGMCLRSSTSCALRPSWCSPTTPSTR